MSSRHWDYQKVCRCHSSFYCHCVADVPPFQLAGLYKCLRPVIQASPHKTAVIYNTNVTLDADTLTCRQDWDADLSLEGYGRTGNIYLHKLRKFGEIVEIDSVGGAMLMIRADLHREGLVFPPYPYRGRIETEGLAAMAKDMGYVMFGLPNVEVLHP
jgi:hypothetical protein